MEVPKQTLSDDQIKIRDDNEKFFEKGLQVRRPYERMWYRNMAFFLGYQYIEWDNYRSGLRVPQKPSWRVRAVVNYIQPNTIHTLSKLTQKRAIFQSVPIDMVNDKATNASEISKIILSHIQQLNKTHLSQQDLSMMMYIYGTAYKQGYWDPFIGKNIGKTGEGKKQKQLFMGDVGIRILSPFEIVWEEGATSMESCQRIGLYYTMSLDEIREKFKYGEYVQSEKVRATSSMESTLMSLLQHKYVAGAEETSTEEDKKEKGYATVCCFMEKPCDDYPQGRMIYRAGRILLDDEKPLPHKFMIDNKTFGIQKYSYYNIHERWLGETPLNQQIPIQIKINRTHSAIQEIENEMVKPKWLVHSQSQINRTSIDNEPGEIIKHSTPPGYDAPHPIEGVEIPVTLFKSLELDGMSMEVTSSQHEVSKGGTTPGVESKVAMQFLNEQDQTVYAPVSSRMEILDEEFYMWCLELAKEQYKEPRHFEILGIDNDLMTYDFMGEEDFPTRLKVIPGSSFPTSLVAEQQTILNYFMGGAFGKQEEIPENLRMRILTVAKVGDVGTIYKHMKIDILAAQREHRLWEKGVMTNVKEYDNHKVMADEHLMFVKSDNFRVIEQSNPQLAQAILDHIKAHEDNTPEMLAQKAQAKAMEEEKNNAIQDKAIERALKTEEITGKKAERLLSLKQAMETGVPEGQTVKE